MPLLKLFGNEQKSANMYIKKKNPIFLARSAIFIPGWIWSIKLLYRRSREILTHADLYEVILMCISKVYKKMNQVHFPLN